jgi:hypothetical protein
VKIARIRFDASGPLRMVRSAVRALEPPQVTKAVEAAVEVFQRGIQARAPHKSGDLARSFRRSMTGPYSGEVGSDLVYAPVQERGAWIGPKRKKTLKFAGSGGPVFLRRPVRIKPQPYVGPTAEQDSPRAFEAFAREIDRAIGN